MKEFIDKMLNDNHIDYKTKYSLLIDFKNSVNQIIFTKINHRTMLVEYNDLLKYIDLKIDFYKNKNDL
jgi:hypothetical protein